MAPMRHLAAVLLLMGLASPAFAGPDPKLVEKGRALYAANRCTLCHSAEGKGNPKGPHAGVGARLSAEEIRGWITKPQEMNAVRKSTRKPAMSSFAHLSAADVDALVAYLQSLPAPK